MAKRVQPVVMASDCMAQGEFTVIARDKDGREVVMGNLEPREFSSGSWGFYLGGKPSFMVNGKPVSLGCSMNLVVPGSKEWALANPGGAAAPAPAAAAPASVTPSGPAALWDPTTKQGTLFPSSEMARSIKAGCPDGWYGRCEVVTSSSPEWNVAKQTCSIPMADGLVKR